MNCRQARELLPLYVDYELSPEQHEAIEGHLVACRECRRLLSLHQRLPGMLAQLPAPDSALEAKVARRVQSAVAGERRGGAWRRGATLAARAAAALLTLALLGSLVYVGFYLASSPEQWAARPTPAASPALEPSAETVRPPAIAEPPSAGKVAFIRAGDIWVKDLPNGEERRLTQDGRNSQPRWSPSGSWLAFHKDKRLWLMHAAGTETQEVGQKDVTHFAWSPAGDQLAYTAEGILYVTGPGGSAPRLLMAPQEIKAGSGVSSFAWSPDGAWLAYANGVLLQPAQGGQPAQRYEFLGAIRPDGTEGHQILDAGNPSQGYFVVAGWSPDSRKVLFWLSPTFSASILADGVSLNAAPADHVRTDKMPGAASENLTDTMLTYPDFLDGTLQYDSLALAVGGSRESWTRKGIAVVELSSGKLVQLTDEKIAALSPVWSPDGQRIVYVSGPDVGPVGGGTDAREAVSQRRLWAMSRDGSNKVQLTKDDAYRDERPRWSPNGAYILWGRWQGEKERDRWQEDKQQLWLMRQDGSDQRLVVDGLHTGDAPRADDWFGFYGHTDWDRLYDWWVSRPVTRPTPTVASASPTPRPQSTPTPAIASPSASVERFELGAYKRVVKATGKFDPPTAPAVYVVDEEAVVRARVKGIARVDVSVGIGASDTAASASGIPDRNGNVEIRLKLPQAGVQYVLRGAGVLAEQRPDCPAVQGGLNGGECVLPNFPALMVVRDPAGPSGSSNLPDPLAAVRFYLNSPAPATLPDRLLDADREAAQQAANPESDYLETHRPAEAAALVRLAEQIDAGIAPAGYAARALAVPAVPSGIPVLALTYGYAGQSSGSGNALAWWQGDELHVQDFPSDSRIGSEWFGQDVLFVDGRQQVREDKVELGLVYTHYGGSAPYQSYRLLRLEGERWRTLWDCRRDGGGQWKWSHATANFAAGQGNADVLAAVSVRASSWSYDLQGRGAFFHESNPGPYRWFRDTWVREGDRYRLADSVVEPSAYATLVEFVYLLSQGQDAEARSLVTDPALVAQTKQLGLNVRPQKPSWLIDLSGPEIEQKGPIKIVEGPQVTVSFEQQGGRWLISRLRPASQPVATPATKPGSTDLDAAQRALITFFSLLHQRRYEEAVKYYGGSYDMLRYWNPLVPEDDYAALLKNGCEVNGLKCLQVGGMLRTEQLSATRFKFVVQFANEDGSVFVRGSCCGATPEQMPPKSEFEYGVEKSDSGYLVLGGPVYLP